MIKKIRQIIGAFFFLAYTFFVWIWWPFFGKETSFLSGVLISFAIWAGWIISPFIAILIAGAASEEENKDN